MAKRKTLMERAAEARDELDWVNAQIGAERLVRAIRDRVPGAAIEYARDALEALTTLDARWQLEAQNRVANAEPE